MTTRTSTCTQSLRTPRVTLMTYLILLSLSTASLFLSGASLALTRATWYYLIRSRPALAMSSGDSRISSARRSLRSRPTLSTSRLRLVAYSAYSSTVRILITAGSRRVSRVQTRQTSTIIRAWSGLVVTLVAMISMIVRASRHPLVST